MIESGNNDERLRLKLAMKEDDVRSNMELEDADEDKR